MRLMLILLRLGQLVSILAGLSFTPEMQKKSTNRGRRITILRFQACQQYIECCYTIKFHPREFNREEIVINIEFPTADYQFQFILFYSDASSVYPGGPLSFRNLNFRIDLGSRIASTKAPPPP
ncbi:BnaC09g12110D [Brassica napus]|uniref:BnaC09g12110D protein n=2 Tax=Brassica TaxID=3705 RepID=A0A078F1P5_BRANA|nr:BnaC09g12110D [Brassica napus]